MALWIAVLPVMACGGGERALEVGFYAYFAPVSYSADVVDADNTELLASLNESIDYLTDNRRIGYAEWRADPTVFMQRAAQWRR